MTKEQGVTNTNELLKLFKLQNIHELFELKNYPEPWIFDGRIITEKLWIFDSMMLREHTGSSISLNYNKLKDYTDEPNYIQIRKRQHEAYTMKMLIFLNYRKQKLIRGLENALKNDYKKDIINTEKKLLKKELLDNDAEILSIKQGFRSYAQIQGWQYLAILQQYLRMSEEGWTECYHNLNDNDHTSRFEALLLYSEWFFEEFNPKLGGTSDPENPSIQRETKRFSDTKGLNVSLPKAEKLQLLENIKVLGLCEPNASTDTWLHLLGNKGVGVAPELQKLNWLKSYSLLHLLLDRLIVNSKTRFDESKKHTIIDHFFLKNGKPINRSSSRSRLSDQIHVKKPKDMEVLDKAFNLTKH